MTKFILILTAALMTSTAGAQEYGFLAGFHQTTATLENSPGSSIDGKFNFKIGLTMGFELAPMMRFRTGAIYNQRHFDLKTTVAATNITAKYQFDYIDVPALFQYNFNETVGIFGGLNVGINVNDKIDVPAGIVAADPETNGLIPLAQVGANFLFDDMIGFDVYYERGLGKIAKDIKDYSTFGANFIYWF